MTPGPNRPEVVLFGEFGCGNLGNEASLDAMLDWLAREPAIRVRCITREPERVTSMHGIPAASMYSNRAWGRRLPRVLAKAVSKVTDQIRMVGLLDRGSIVVVPGMGVFEQDLSGPPWGLPMAFLGLSVAVRVRGARLALVGVGASPDDRRVVRWMNRRVLATADLVTFRDTYSRDSMASQGVDVTDSRVFPDIAFSGAPESAAVVEHAQRIGVGVLSYYDILEPERGAVVAGAYEDRLAEFCAGLIRSGRTIELLIGDASDEAVVDRLEKALEVALGPEACEESVRFERVSDHRLLSSTIARQDVVVGSRYHNLIFALKAGRPVLSINYARKHAELLRAAGLGDFAVDLDTLADADLQRRFARLVEGLDDFGERARGYSRSARALSQEHADLFLRWVDQVGSARANRS